MDARASCRRDTGAPPRCRRCSSPSTVGRAARRACRAAPASSSAGVDPDQRGGQDADRREHAEAAAHVRRDVERRDLLVARDGAQRALLRIGDEHEPLACAGLAEHLVEPRADDEVLRHRLRRAARLRDHDEQRCGAGRAGRAARRCWPDRRCRARAAAARRRAPRRRAGSTAADGATVRSAMGPSAEPPMPSTTTSVSSPARDLHAPHVVERLLVQRAIVGQVEEAERSARILVRDAAVRVLEARRRPRAIRIRVIPPSIGGAIMFV